MEKFSINEDIIFEDKGQVFLYEKGTVLTEGDFEQLYQKRHLLPPKQKKIIEKYYEKFQKTQARTEIEPSRPENLKLDISPDIILASVQSGKVHPNLEKFMDSEGESIDFENAFTYTWIPDHEVFTDDSGVMHDHMYDDYGDLRDKIMSMSSKDGLVEGRVLGKFAFTWFPVPNKYQKPFLDAVNEVAEETVTEIIPPHNFK